MKINFTITELPCYAIAHKNGRKTLDMQAFDGQIEFALQYTYDRDRRPLRLVSPIKENDKVEVVILPHRIELYINGEIKDKEWPMDERLFEKGDEIRSNIEISVSDYTAEETVEPDVCGEFENAEGWQPYENVFVGDCMPYTKDGEYHVLYLIDRHHHTSKWGLGGHEWGHISTKDLNSWKIHPTAVPLTDSAEGSFCTGSWLRDGDKEYLYYTVRLKPGVDRPVRRSISSDGYHYEKDASFRFSIPKKYRGFTARDPKLIKGTDGLYHMLLTTTLLEEARGCVAHFVSPDMEEWTDKGPIFVSPDNTEPECPDYIEYNGRYYLIYSLHGQAHYLISDKPFEDWREPANSNIPCAVVPKGAVWSDKIVFAGFKRVTGNAYAGKMTFKSAYADENGELVFCDL